MKESNDNILLLVIWSTVLALVGIILSMSVANVVVNRNLNKMFGECERTGVRDECYRDGLTVWVHQCSEYEFYTFSGFSTSTIARCNSTPFSISQFLQRYINDTEIEFEYYSTTSTEIRSKLVNKK